MTAEERLKSPRLRLFVALELPDDLVGRLVAWREEAFAGQADVRLLPRDSMHATLVFLGYRAARDVERIAEVAFGEPGEPFELRPQAVVRVPARRPRLYALRLEDSRGALVRWQGALSERLRRARLYEPEKRPFWPHVTVARVKRGRERAVSFEPGELPEGIRRPFQAQRVTLYQSTLTARGAIYEPLAGLELRSR